jgi:hypothetical protein
MSFKRKPTPHQKQMRFFAFFFGGIMISIAILLMWFLSRRSAFIH